MSEFPESIMEAQEQVGEWNERTFGREKSKNAHINATLAKLAEEAIELVGPALMWSALQKWATIGFVQSSGNIERETPDLFIVLLSLCDLQDINLHEATAEKFALLEKSEWVPSADGTFRRVKGQEEAE